MYILYTIYIYRQLGVQEDIFAAIEPLLEKRSSTYMEKVLYISYTTLTVFEQGGARRGFHYTILY